MTEPGGARHRSSNVLFALATTAAAASLIIVLSGGFSIRIFGVRISSHGALRPALLALLFASIAYRHMPEWQWATLSRRGRAGVALVVRWTPALAAAIVLVLCFRFGTRAAGGSDSYGYVSQARLC